MNRLDDLPDGVTCFVDANILYYCFVEVPNVSEPCRRLMARIRACNVIGVCDTRGITDCIHKVMLAEISKVHGQSRDRLIGWLKKHPEALSSLPGTREVVRRITMLNLRILSADPGLLPRAIEWSERCLLLTNDAVMVSLMIREGITHLATHDNDFDRVPEIHVWKP